MATDVSALRKDADLAASPDRGYTLPAKWSTDPAVLEIEQERVFLRSGQIAQPGAYFTCRVGTVPVLVDRDEQGELRAVANVCRHRGSQLVLNECVRRKTLQCHYHAWNSKGTLRTVPCWHEQPGMDKDGFPLVLLKLETRGPLIFVNPDAKAAPLSEVLEDLLVLVVGVGLDVTN